MLSEDLQSIHDLLKAYGGEGVRLQPEAVKNLCASLRAAAQDAKALEDCVPENMCEATAQVIDLNCARSRKATNDWLHSQGLRVLPNDPDGGDAA